MSEENFLLRKWRQVYKLPRGKWLFSNLFSRMAPYFKTIDAQVLELEPNYCTLLIKKRKKVQNHIGTVHVIAIANGLEMAMGAVAEASIPSHLRWIPKGMELNYVKKAATDIKAEAVVDPKDWKPGDLYVKVTGYDTHGDPVVEGNIKLWISEKPKK